MSFGSGAKYSAVKYTGLQLQTSTSTACVPLIWGAAQTAGNLIYYTDFKAKPVKTKGKGGGKETTSYNYSATIIVALSQGPIHGIGKVWVNQSTTTFSATGFSLFLGTTPQSPWSYVVSAHPAEAMNYNGIAYFAKANYGMGNSPSLPSNQMEVQGMRWGSQVGGDGNDADPALIIEDYLTNTTWGVGIPGSIIGNLLSTTAAPTTGDSAFQTYCQAMGFGLSPALTSQEQALTTLDRWTQITNTACYWSGYALKFVPYGDEEITANGVTYIPPITPVYNLTDADFVKLQDEDPVKVIRTDLADAYNSVKITIKDRNNYYADTPVILQDQNLIQLYGVREDSGLQASEVCLQSMAAIMVQLRMQRLAYMRNTYEFQLPWSFCLLEPMDVVTITDVNLGFNQLTIRVTGVEEADDGSLKIDAEQLTVGVSSGTGYATQPVTNNPQNSAINPDPVNTPVIFEPPSALTNGIAEVWFALSGGAGSPAVADPNWGGCQIWVSTDNATYSQVGEIETPSTQGILTAGLATYTGANPDNTNTLAISTNMSDAEVIGGNATDAANGMLLCYVDGELISFENATLTGTNAYNLTTLYRGMFGSTIGAHASGTQFARLDGGVFQFQLPQSYIGHTLYFKFPSFNIWGQQLQDLSTCTAYTYTPVGTGFGGGSGGVPKAPTGLTATGSTQQVLVAWNANASTDNVSGYNVYRAPGLGASFSSATKVSTLGNSLNTTDASVAANSNYTYFVTAVNAVGESAPSTGANATTNGTALLPPIYVPSVFFPGLMNGSQIMLIHQFAEACTLPANGAGSQFGATVAATSSTTITILKALAATPNSWTTAGTISISGGTEIGVFATTGGAAITFAAGDRIMLQGATTPDTTLANVSITLFLNRNT